MNIQYCFPTAIFSTINEALADEMLPIAKAILSHDHMINHRWNYKTTYNANGGVEVFDEMQPFIKYIKEIGKTFILKQGYTPWFNDFQTNIFVSEMFKGDFHNTHTHPNSTLSGVFYLQTPQGSSPIIFHDPRPKSNFFTRQVSFDTDSNRDIITITPQKGLFLMWESWLAHSVLHNTNEEGRITIVFNLR